MTKRATRFPHIDWILVLSAAPLLLAGLATMRSFGAENDYFFSRQIIWIAVSFAVFFLFSFIDWRFLRKGELLMALWLVFLGIFVFLLLFGRITRGTLSWLTIKSLAIEPSEFFKLILILVLAKYFSRRHIEIGNIRHIAISGFYFLVPGILVFLQPDLGSFVILFFIWLGMIMVSGVSKKHLLLVFVVLAVSFSIAWLFLLHPYQKQRILVFLNPFQDVKGAGYNAVQSMIAVGSGRIFGKGVGFGSQSRLNFLPEPQTDFIFAAFSEEWGLVGVILLFIFFGIVIWRILKIAYLGQSNFESLYGIGLAIFLLTHFAVHIGVNVGLLPITGTTLPFMSYGGSHMITIFAGLGILMGMRRYAGSSYREDMTAEFLEL